MQRATRRVRFLTEDRPDVLPTLRYVIRYAVREPSPAVLPQHVQELPAEPAWALIKETTEILPTGAQRLWVQQLQPNQLQLALQCQPAFHGRVASGAYGSGGCRGGLPHHEAARPVYRGAAALERAVAKAKESTQQAAAAAAQAAEAVAAAYTAARAATATAGVAAGAAAAAKARVTNMPPYTMELRISEEYPRRLRLGRDLLFSSASQDSRSTVPCC
ncbi:hypothetical protein Efla_000885 [Eimeria flavescens]